MRSLIQICRDFDVSLGGWAVDATVQNGCRGVCKVENEVLGACSWERVWQRSEDGRLCVCIRSPVDTLRISRIIPTSLCVGIVGVHIIGDLEF